MKIKAASEFEMDDRLPLQASPDLREWINSLPNDAMLTPIQIDQGSQRDPWVVTIGLRAHWEETR